MDTQKYPNRLRHYRRIAGLSQKKVARILALYDTSMLSRWEHGRSLPSILQTFSLSKIYRVLPHELFLDLWKQAHEEDSRLVQNEIITS